jgi:transposase InsO family protein
MVTKPSLLWEAKVDIHKNARSCVASRELLVERVLEQKVPIAQAAEALGLSTRQAYRWLQRFRAEGRSGLCDRSSRPHRLPGRTAPELVDQVLALRRQRCSGPQIAFLLGMPRSTVARWLRRHGLHRLRALETREPARRYEKACPGELLHVDTKKLGRIVRLGHRMSGNPRHHVRGAGWEFLHVAIDDASRLAYLEMLPDERQRTCAAFLQRACRWYRRQGVVPQALLTDNGSAYLSRRFAKTCHNLSIRHARTRPYRPRTNGKAERLIQTLLREWAYRFPYHSSRQRRRALPRFQHFYNHHRQHSALGGLPPVSRLNNAVRLDI